MPRILQLPLLSLAVLIALFIGAEAAFGASRPDLLVKGAADPDASYVGGGVFESTASLQSVSQAAFQATPAAFRVLLSNVGDAADSFTLRATPSGPGFTVRYLDEAGVDRTAALAGAGLDTAALAPGASFSLLVQVSVISQAPGASYRVSVSATSLSDAGMIDQVKTETVACGSAAAVTVSAPPDGAGAPGTQITYPYTVTNVGSGANTFALSAITSNSWQATLRALDGSSTTSTGPLAPGTSYRFQLVVSVPPGGLNGDRSDSTLTVAGEGTSGSDAVTTTVLAPTVSVTENVRNITQGGVFETTTTAFPGDILEYRMSITNSGSAAATEVSIDSTLPANTSSVADSQWIGTSSSGNGTRCAAAECGSVREASGRLIARLGQGATDTAGGALSPGKTLYVYFRVQVN